MKKFYYLLAAVIMVSSCAPANYYSFQLKSKPHSRIAIDEKAGFDKSSSENEFFNEVPAEVPLAVATTDDNIVKEAIVTQQISAFKSALKIKEIVEEKREAKANGVKLTKEEKKENRVALKEAKKDFKESLKAMYQNSSGKSQLVALILVILVGGLGIHRFYLGYTSIGIIQLLTLGGCGIWALIDLIRIATGDLQPKDGTYSETI